VDKKTFAVDFGFLAASRFVTYAAIFISGILLTRGLSRADYGTISQVTLLATSISLVLGTWIAKSLYYFLPKSGFRGAIGFQTTMFTGLLGIAGGGALWCMGPWLASRFDNAQLALVAPVLGFYLATLVPYACLQPFMVSVGRARVLAACLTISSVGMLGGVAYGIWKHLPVSYLILIMACIYLAVWVFLIVENVGLARKEGRLLVLETLGKQLRYSGPLFFSSATIVAARYLDRFIVASLFSVEDFAIYYRGAIELPFVVIIVYSLMSMLLPKFVEMYKESRLSELTYTWHSSIKKTCLIMFPALVGFALLSKDIIVFLYGERYAGSAVVFQIYVLALFFQTTGYDSVAQAVNRTRLVLEAALVGVIVNFSSALILIRWLGPPGAALGMVISQGCLMLYYHRKLSRVLRVPMLGVYPWRSVMLVLAIAVSTGMACYGVLEAFGRFSGGPRILLFGLLFGVSYLGIAFRLKLLSREDLALFGVRIPGGGKTQ